MRAGDDTLLLEWQVAGERLRELAPQKWAALCELVRRYTDGELTVEQLLDAVTALRGAA